MHKNLIDLLTRLSGTFQFKILHPMKKILTGLLLLGAFVALTPACKKKPKDEDLKAAIEKVVGSGVTVNVAEGVATLSGEVMDDAAKTAAETAAKAVEGVASVTNNITIAPPPPPPVEIAVDQELIKSVADAVSMFKGVSAEVKDGVVTLTGEIKKADLAKLMSSVMALKPKSVENKLTVK
jgi:hyperosmotically inducible periplasmic protein